MIPAIEEIINVPDEVKTSAANGNLVLFIGAGVSRIAGLPGWDKWAQNILLELQKKQLITYAEIEQLKELDPRKQLSIAKIIAKKNLVNLDYTESLKIKNEHEIYKYLNQIGCTFVTTNYDKHLSVESAKTVHYTESKSVNNISQESRLRIYDKGKLFETHLRNPGNVIHLHGCIDNQDEMIITMSDYLAHYDDETVVEFLKNLFNKYTVVFIGYGLEEIDVLEYILKKGKTEKESIKKRFYLEGFFSYQEMLYKNLVGYYKETFGVHLLGFKRDENDFNQLVKIMGEWCSEIKVNPPALIKDLDVLDEVLANE